MYNKIKVEIRKTYVMWYHRPGPKLVANLLNNHWILTFHIIGLIFRSKKIQTLIKTLQSYLI